VILAVDFQGGIENAWSNDDATVATDSSATEEFGTGHGRWRGR
jgi:hypothetical protein